MVCDGSSHSIALNIFAGVVMNTRRGSARRFALGIAVAANLLLLATFKYANFLAANLTTFLQSSRGPVLPDKIALPLGISFFTFHCLSYIIDVYRRRFGQSRSRPIALYISLFPQLVAGPIVRYKTVARQLDARRYTLSRASAGARIFISASHRRSWWPIRCATRRGGVRPPPLPSMAEAWTGLIAYTFQIYFDFAGYSNMAIGLGFVLGFTFPRNFRLPYSSLSITEFWRRWHMSLSAWLRDYLHSARRQPRRRANLRNLLMVFILCGLWHGANWTFVLWGAWHGGFLVLERLGFGAALARLARPARWAYALLVVMGGWVLFRSTDLSAAIGYFASLFGRDGFGEISFDMHDALNDRVIMTLVIGSALAFTPPGPPNGPRHY